MSEFLNIAHYLPEVAKKYPYKRAVIINKFSFGDGRRAYRHYTFQQLNNRCDIIAHGLQKKGVKAGQKVLLMVTSSLDLFALVFALFKLKAIPVMIDPGMGIKGFFKCIAQVQPDVMIGLPIVNLFRIIKPKLFRDIKIKITWFDGRNFSFPREIRNVSEKLRSIHEFPFPKEVQDEQGPEFPITPCTADETAAILFTSGSTGPAKGVVYTHKIFNAQVEILRDIYKISADDIDMPCFPLFALFSVALGATVIVPPMNPAKPAKANPQRLLTMILDQGVTYSFGSPTIWQNVTRYAQKHQIQTPSLRRVLVAGAPVPAELHQRFYDSMLLPTAEIFTPYGATESLPVANMTGREVLAETASLTAQGKGICVGKPLPTIELKIIKITDDPIAEWTDQLEVPQGTIGEICVKGDVVTQEYYGLPQATAASKIQDGTVKRHRIGDVGYLDEKGRIWFCGRKGHRVETRNKCYFSICCEAIANQHPMVKRSALAARKMATGENTPVICIELKPEVTENTDKIISEVKELLRHNPLTMDIQEVRIHPGFPVDVRHNAKINREILTAWLNS